MSKYYQINDLKVRVSDHEPNFSMDRIRGVNDVELYVKDVCNNLLSIENQLESICNKKGYNISDFQEVINDWRDGTYDKNVFNKKEEETIEESSCESLNEILNNTRESNVNKLKGYTLSRFAKHEEIKALSEKTGISQSYIKKYFGIR